MSRPELDELDTREDTIRWLRDHPGAHTTKDIASGVSKAYHSGRAYVNPGVVQRVVESEPAVDRGRRESGRGGRVRVYQITARAA